MQTDLYQGDCLDVITLIPDESVDLVVTSPPYDNLRTYNGNLDWGNHVWSLAIKGLFRVVKQGGVVVWIVGDATIKGSETGNSFRQALYFMECGFNLHDTMIWNKGTFTAVGALVNRYAPVFEYMFVFSKGYPKTFNPIKDRLNKSAGKKHNGTIRQPNGTTKPLSNIGKIIPKYGQRFNIWDNFAEKSNSKRLHPAMFPENLVKDHILSWSNKEDTVLDPFMGSGTTGKMAVLNNRKFIGIEKDNEYFEIARNRIEQSKKQIANEHKTY